MRLTLENEIDIGEWDWHWRMRLTLENEIDIGEWDRITLQMQQALHWFQNVPRVYVWHIHTKVFHICKRVVIYISTISQWFPIPCAARFHCVSSCVTDTHESRHIYILGIRISISRTVGFYCATPVWQTKWVMFMHFSCQITYFGISGTKCQKT